MAAVNPLEIAGRDGLLDGISSDGRRLDQLSDRAARACLVCTGTRGWTMTTPRPRRQGRQAFQFLADTGAAHGAATDAEGTSAPRPAPRRQRFLFLAASPQLVRARRTAAQSVPSSQSGGDGDMLSIWSVT